MSYDIEIRKVSQHKDGQTRWFTPDEARSYYGKYARSGITIHWWGDGGKNNHEQTVAFFERRTDGSVNYVLSDDRITYMVDPKNVAFTSQSGNATTISIECQTYLGNEGYKKLGWLISELEDIFGGLKLYPHNHWFATQCPGSLDLTRARNEANKWNNGEYNPKPPVTPPAPQPAPVPKITLQITDILNKKVRLVKDANLWDLHFTKYSEAQSIKTLKKGTAIEVSAIAKHPLGSSYYLSEYSFAKGIGNGINIKDCEDVFPLPDIPAPKPTPVPVPVITKDEEQDRRLSAIEAFIELLKKFFKGE